MGHGQWLPLEIIRKFVRKLRINQCLVEGRDRDDGHPLTVLFMGREADRRYFSELVFEAGYRERAQRRRWIWSLWSVIKRCPADVLVIGGVGEVLFRCLGDRCCFYIPNWLRGEIAFEDALARSKSSSHVKSDLRRIRKHSLTYEVTRSPEQLKAFYHTMYVPHVSATFGRTAHLTAYEQLETVLDDAELMLVSKEGTAIAGQILLHEHERVRGWHIGVKDGNREYVKMGAQAALYWFETQYLSQCGYQGMHVGASRSFLRDGVLRFKTKWGMRVCGHTPDGFLLKPMQASAATLSLLKHNPFVQLQDGCLSAVAYADDSTSFNEVMKLYATYQGNGIDSLTLYLPAHQQAAVAVPGELRASVVLQTVEHLFGSGAGH